MFYSSLLRKYQGQFGPWYRYGTLPSPQVIDARGGASDLAAMGEGIANIITAIKEARDRKDPVKVAQRLAEEQPELARQMAAAGHETAATSDRGGQLVATPGLTPQRPPTPEGLTPSSVQPGIPQTVRTPTRTEPPELPDFGGIVPKGTVEILMKLYPEAREAQVARATRGLITPEEEATLRVDAIRSAGEVASAEGAQARRQRLLLDAMNNQGFTPDRQAEILTRQAELDAVGINLDLQGLEAYQKIYEESNPYDQKIIATSLAQGRGAGFLQYLLQERRFDHESGMADLRGSLANAKDPLEVAQARLKYTNDVRAERDRIVGLINEAIERKQYDLLEGYVGDIRGLVGDLLLVDPAAAATTANAVRGLFGKVKDVKFSLTDIVQDRGDLITMYSEWLKGAGNTQTAKTKLRESLADVYTGEVPEALYEAIVRVAEEPDDASEIADRAAAEAALTIQSGAVPPYQQRQNEIEELRGRLDEAIQQGDYRTIVATRDALFWKRLVSWFMGPGEVTSVTGVHTQGMGGR